MAIKVYTALQKGAPVLCGVPGSLIDVLDAVLVNGYGESNVMSINRSGVIATVDTDSPHGFSTGDVALISGASEPEYNGEFVVTVTGSTSFTYDVTGSPSTPATGTITAKRAPAGFSKVFADTNKAVYRSNDLSSRRHYFRIVDDSTTPGGAREARLWGYETMLDIDTGTGMYPTVGQHPDGFFCQKSNFLDSYGRHWVLITDGKTVYHFVYNNSDTGHPELINYPYAEMSAYGFGDALAYNPGDAYLSWVTGNPNTNEFYPPWRCGLFNAARWIIADSPTSTNATVIAARDYTGVPGARHMQLFGTGMINTLGASDVMPYPHPIDNGFYMVPVLLTQGWPSVIRGRMPGLYEPLHGRCFPNTQIIENVIGFPGRKFMMLWGRNGAFSKGSMPVVGGSDGALVVDITGPWDS